MKSSVFEDTMTPRLDKLFWALTVALLAILSTSTATAAQPQSDRTSNASPAQVRHGPRTLPNIIFILADDMDSKNLTEQKIMFPAPTSKAFIKFEVTDAISAGGQPIAAIGELDVLVEPVTPQKSQR